MREKDFKIDKSFNGDTIIFISKYKGKSDIVVRASSEKKLKIKIRQLIAEYDIKEVPIDDTSDEKRSVAIRKESTSKRLRNAKKKH